MDFNTIKILHLDSNHPYLWDTLESLGFSNTADFTSSKAEIMARMSEYQGIVIRSRFPIDKAFIDSATQLQFIARVGAGLESIDCDYAQEKNITLIAAPEGNSNAVGEHALGMLLNVFNNLNQANAQIRQGVWQREGNRGHELEGKTIGLIGYGNMGKSFAKKLAGFDVKVLCYDLEKNVGDAHAQQVSLQELQQQADVLSLHVPWTPLTHQLVNKNFIDAFAKPFWLINTARGKNVVTADLVEALQSGQILGAGLDVLEFEKSSFETLFQENTSEIPPAFQALLAMPNVLLSPHIAGWTHESHLKLAQVIVAKIKQKYLDEKTGVEIPAKVTGIGGFFFKSTNSKELIEWYRTNLGLVTDDYGSTFWWKDNDGNQCATQWSPFSDQTDYFSPSEKPFMQNFRVQNLVLLLKELEAKGIKQIGESQSFEYGTFAWIMDPEGNKVELWEPIDHVFLT